MPPDTPLAAPDRINGAAPFAWEEGAAWSGRVLLG